MFGLPWETTLIMGGGILFWVAYTLIFYFRTKQWSIEDADYEQSTMPDPDEGSRL